MKKSYWLAEWGDVSFIFHAFSRKEVWKKLHFHIIHFSAFPLSDGSKLAALFQVCEKRIPRGTFSYKFSWKTYLKNSQFIYLNYLRKMVIFHSYVSLPEGYRVMFCQFFSHGIRLSTQVPPASRTRIIRYLESQVYKDRCESKHQRWGGQWDRDGAEDWSLSGWW